MTGRQILQGAHILTMDAQLGELVGDVLIEDGQILEVSERIRADDAEVIDVRGSIVMPGLIDTHIHLWQSAFRGLASEAWAMEYFGLVHPLAGRLRASDMYAATLGGAIELLLSGTTTAFDFCHATNSPEHAEASLNALADSGIRGLFGFCFRHRPEAAIEGFTTLDERFEVLARLARDWGTHERVGLGVALNNIDHVDAEVHEQEVAAARKLGLRLAIHSNLPGQVTVSDQRGLLGDDLMWVHAGPVDDRELSLLASQGGAICFTPEVEAAHMGVAPSASRARRRNVALSVGTDIPAGINGDLLAQLRIARAVTRVLDVQHERAENRSGSRTPSHPSFDSMDLLRLATIEGARVLGLDEAVGSLTPGKRADLLVFSTAPFGLGGGAPADFVLCQATARSLTHVYVEGELVVRDGQFLRGDLVRVRRDLDEARDWVLGRAPDSHWPELDEELRARYEAGQGKAS